MTTLHTASRQWATRPADQRFLDLPSLTARAARARELSHTEVHRADAVSVAATEDDQLVLHGPAEPHVLTHHSFGQLASRARAQAQYLRTLPASLSAACLTHGLEAHSEEDLELSLLLADGEVRATTSPKYGRVWDVDVCRALEARFGDGRTGQFRVPGEFGQQVDVTTQNTTIYGSDHDMFVFLADESSRLGVRNRRDGKRGELSRGFFCWNSEVGDRSLGVAFFLFDYVCSNRIVWGATDVEALVVRHTSGAPDRWLDAVLPRLEEYVQASARPMEQQIARAQQMRLEDPIAVMRRQFSMMEKDARRVLDVHQLEEGRPVETVWDVVTGITAAAKSIEHTDRRVTMEKLAGRVLQMAAE